MAHGSDIRRIGKYMRAHGADGSLVAWVEAEFDRLDLQAIEPSDLQPLREDLTVRERELIVAATLHLASAAHKVRMDALDIAQGVGRALGFDPARLDQIAQHSMGRTLSQAQLLAELSLGIDASPDEVRAAEQARPHVQPAPNVLDSLIGEVTDPQGPPPLSSVLPDLPGQADGTESHRHTERMDHLAEALRALDEPDDLEEPTVEMSRDEARAAAERARSRHTTADPIAPPRFSPAAGVHDGPPTLGVDDGDLAALASAFDAPAADEGVDGLDELIPWDDDALSVPEWTISEHPEAGASVADERQAPSPTLEPEPEPPAPPSHLYDEPPLPPLPGHTGGDDPFEDLDLDDGGPASLDDLHPEALDELSLDMEVDGWGVRRHVTEELPLGLTDEVPTLQPHRAHRSTGDGLTDELRVVDPDAYEELALDGDGLTGELRHVDDEDRLKGSGGRRESWSPPASLGDPSDGLDLVLEEVPGRDTFELPLPEEALDEGLGALQPLDQGLKAYWGDKSEGGLSPRPLSLPDDFDASSAEAGDGLTSELKVVHDDDPVAPERRRRRGDSREGLTQDLQPLFEAPAPSKRQRRGRRDSEGLTQELKPLLDDD